MSIDGKILTEFATLRPKTSRYLTNVSNGNKKAKGTKRIIKQKLEFEDYKDCLEATQLENEMNQLEKN